MSLTIRKIGEDEVETIAALAAKIWPISYQGVITNEQIDYMLKLMYSKDKLQQNMADGYSFHLLEDDGEPAGFAAHGLNGDGIYRLEKLYVDTTRHGKGFGKMLLNKVAECAAEKNAKSVQLNVNRNNNAYHFYLKNGFTVAHETVLDIGNGFVMDDYVMEKELGVS